MVVPLLGITAFLTLSTISLDARTDLPKVHYATALDWFILMSFGYCMASILEFAGVHVRIRLNTPILLKRNIIIDSYSEHGDGLYQYFTKVRLFNLFHSQLIYYFTFSTTFSFYSSKTDSSFHFF